jgi:ubiquinone/menaquinone biosynthesis C-methylase UbiE
MRRLEKGGSARLVLPEEFRGKAVSVEGLFGIVRDFTAARREHHKALEEAERGILSAYERFSPEDRVRFFSILYDRFSGRYDRHMGAETGHYRAIANLLFFAMPHVRFPLLDVTAGTGEPLGMVLEAARLAQGIRATEFGSRFSGMLPQGIGTAYANEISPRMLKIAKLKLADSNVTFINSSAFDLRLEGMGSVLCSQTFHLIADEDKTKLVRAIHRSLADGGTAIVMEEEPFRISPTPSIEEVSLFLRAVACPIKADALIGRFEVNGFTKLEQRASYPIDSEHIMRLHMFVKNVTPI